MRFLRHGFCLPPVLRRLWRESREIPGVRGRRGSGKTGQHVCDGWATKIKAGTAMGPETRVARVGRDARGGVGVRPHCNKHVPMLYPFTRRSRACRKDRTVGRTRVEANAWLGSALGNRFWVIVWVFRPRKAHFFDTGPSRFPPWKSAKRPRNRIIHKVAVVQTATRVGCVTCWGCAFCFCEATK